MFGTIINSWALFTGFGLIMLAHALQGTLLNINAVLFNFTDFEIGYVFSGYFLGYLFSSIQCPKLIKNVGHIRVFAAFASLGSIAILLHWVVVNPIAWLIFRMITGFSFAAIYIVCESWLNDRADNNSRGQLIGFYMIVLYFSNCGGVLLVNLSPTSEAYLYILISLLISVALVPILLTKKPAPDISTPKFISLKELFLKSPMAFVGSFAIGLIYSALFGLMGVFGAKIGLSVFQISIMFFVNTFIGAVFQYPVGKISDKFDRRTILFVLNIIAIASLIFAFLFGPSSFYILLIFIGIHSAVSLPYYAVVISHMNDFLEKEEIISGSSTLTLVNALGMVMGPLLASLFMAYFGAYGYFVYMIVIYCLVAPYNFARIRVGRTSDIYEDNTPSMIVPRTTSSVGMQLATDQIINKIEEDEEKTS
ncbi:MFS transporter [Alphaproteobacteria bacterium]|jgi:MFS family permease|nr:MFS transporter [Alphaproteobacteria bacterium]MDB3863461.1 MFS transporter [Alphaproteobacteria bacterium]MDB3974041.1 MFS transporter [Alphaproteobacteria bacterium]MDC0594431.1 MFS transporter [Alphaproteobacteria bacterium]|tara:strand:+ start:108 stop:1373 length:1266 start_codon:yes stop_codon:yes gene_type:complete